MIQKLLFICFLLNVHVLHAQTSRWEIQSGNSIIWHIDQRGLSRKRSAAFICRSGLYARIFTEGMFGVRPTGLNSFTCTPRLPGGWDTMSLKNMHVFGKVFDLEVQRKTGQQLEINVITST